MWEINSLQQTVAFFCALIAGFFLGLLYDLPRSLRKVFDLSVAHIAVSDFAFSALAAILCFLLELCLTAGQIRLYFITGIAAGFFLERYTVSRFHVRMLVFFLRNLRKAKTGLSSFFRQKTKQFSRKSAIRFEKIARFLKKAAKSLKKLLKIG